MTVIINGTTGITSVNGTAGAPSVTGTDTDTGIVYGTNTVTIATNGTAGLSQNSVQGVQIPNTLGVGGTTPSTSGAGITFPATQSASTDANTLDDYEEGTFTSTVTYSSTVTSTSLTQTLSATGKYVKIGNLVTYQIALDRANTFGGVSVVFESMTIPFNMVSSTCAGGVVFYNAQGRYGATVFTGNFQFVAGLYNTTLVCQSRTIDGNGGGFTYFNISTAQIQITVTGIAQ